MKTVELNPIVRLLLRVRERINNSWCPNSSCNNGQLCTFAAFYTDETYKEANLPLFYRAWEFVGMTPIQMVAWNNAPGQTKRNVLARIDGAIQRSLDARFLQ
jgi:hypothetical protein